MGSIHKLIFTIFKHYIYENNNRYHTSLSKLKLTCIIIDDEPLARKRLNSLADETPELLVLESCGTGQEAIALIDNLKPDLIFLDIQMKDMTGFDVLAKIKTEKRPLVVFVTAFDKYAVKAFDIFAIDYLLKPFKKDRFLLSVQRALAQFEKQDGYDAKMNHLLEFVANSVRTESDPFRNKFPIKTGNAISFIEIDTIMYILASGSYVDIITEKKSHVHRMSLHQILNEIGTTTLLRIHRSTVINLNFIDKIVQSNYGEIDVKMKDGKLLRVSKTYKKHLQSLLGI